MPKRKITERKDGRYQVQVYLGRDLETGKRKYKVVYGATQKEVDEKALEIRLSLRKGIDISAQRDTFGEWADRWIKIKKQDICNGQIVSYESAIKHLEKLRNMSISKIRMADLQDIINDLAAENPSTNKPTSKRTLDGIKSTARQIFDLAVENRVMEYNPAQYVRIPAKAPKDSRRALTGEEQQWILNTPHRAQRGAMIMMYAGLRRGEIIPLTWGDIDLQSRTIAVNKSVEMIDGQARQKDGAKTAAGSRVVDIPQRLADFLTFEKKKAGNPPPDALVCPSAHGKMMSVSAWRRLWESYLSDLNIKYGDFGEYMTATKKPRPRSKFDPDGVPLVISKITAHWLRHTFATLLYMAGVDILTAKEQLGHRDIKTTLEIYTHLDKIYKRKSMSKLDDYLNPIKKDDASQMQVKESNGTA